jgi:hypothetical protein
MPVGRVLVMADTTQNLADDQRSFARAIDGRVFIRDDFRESIAVFTSRVPPAGRVVGIWRRS